VKDRLRLKSWKKTKNAFGESTVSGSEKWKEKNPGVERGGENLKNRVKKPTKVQDAKGRKTQEVGLPPAGKGRNRSKKNKGIPYAPRGGGKTIGKLKHRQRTRIEVEAGASSKASDGNSVDDRGAKTEKHFQRGRGGKGCGAGKGEILARKGLQNGTVRTRRRRRREGKRKEAPGKESKLRAPPQRRTKIPKGTDSTARSGEKRRLVAGKGKAPTNQVNEAETRLVTAPKKKKEKRGD